MITIGQARRWAQGSAVRSNGLLLATLGLLALTPGPGGAAGEEPHALPRVEVVTAPSRLKVDVEAPLTLAFVAPEADVVALGLVVETLDGPPSRRTTSQREIGLVATAYGRRTGILTIPLRFPTPGRRRLTLTPITEAREVGEPVTMEVEVGP